MLRKRERFERTDVPRNNPQRNVIAVIVIVLVAIATTAVTALCWHKANQLNGLNDLKLDDALYEQKYVEDPTGNAKWAEDEFSNVAVFIVDDIHAKSPQLQEAYILVRDTTNPSATLVNMPMNTKMLAGEANVTVKSHFDYAGAAACLAPFTAAANIHVSHVIVASNRLWEQLEKLEGPTSVTLLSSATDELATINTDYHTGELIKLADFLRQVGFSNIRRIDAAYNEENFEDGTVVAAIDKQRVCIDAGLFVETEPEPEPEPEGEGGEGSEEGTYEGEWA